MSLRAQLRLLAVITALAEFYGGYIMLSFSFAAFVVYVIVLCAIPTLIRLWYRRVRN
jgi:hypothetical protein